MKYNITNLGEVDVIYRYTDTLNDRPVIKSADEAITIFKQLFISEKLGLQEQFVVIYLNRCNKVIGTSNLFVGGVSGTVVDLKILLSVGIKLMATGILVSHNHPSGNLQPSDADIKLTKKIVQALECLDMTLLDHLIISPEFKYLSFANEGLLS
jgi:DNA repair protein RadC